MSRIDAEKEIAEAPFCEEVANAVSHGIGVLLSIAALVLLTVAAVDAPHTARLPAVIGGVLFGTSLMFLYTMSTLYHAFPKGRVKQALQQYDHAAIFILIAGSYSAFCLSVLYDSIGVGLFWTVWALAAAGISTQILLPKIAHPISLVLYLVMGWLIIVQYNTLTECFSPAAFWLLLSGGIAYTVGFIFYALQRFPWMHPVWHLFVLGGSICHVLSVLFLL